MKKFDLNALDLEKITGVPSSTIYRLIKNKDGNPTIEVLRKLSSFFQITVSQLIGEEPIGIRQVSLVPMDEILDFLKATSEDKSKYRTIPIDFPLNSKCFATFVQDDLMEPFILINSIVIIDPEREFSSKDFILYIKDNQSLPQIRQIIKDGSDIYLKVLNYNFPNSLDNIKKINDFSFIGVIVHYRINLFNFNKNDAASDLITEAANNK